MTVGSVVGGFLVIAQAFAVTDFVVTAVRGRSLLGAALALAGVLVARAVVSLFVDWQSASAASRVATGLRERVLAGLLRSEPTADSAGAAAALTTRGVEAAEPYVTRYLPAALLSVVVPPLVIVAIATQDLLTAAIVVVTLPLVPLFGWLVGVATRDRAEAQWRAMASLAGHFVDVMRGLPTLVAYGRAEAQSASIAEASARYRRRTMETLKIAFASSAILELVATLSVALVAVVVGVRLAVGDLGLGTGLVVLLLAPEAYAPIRRAGAEFHAAAEGRTTFEKVAAYGAGPTVEADLPTAGGAGEPGGLELVDVTVRYPGRNQAALERCSVSIPDTGLTVVAGPSGAGKSTLLGVMAGLVPCAAGGLRVGGVAVGGRLWQDQVAWVPQVPTFLAGSVARNLRVAEPEATDAQLWHVLESVGLADRVRASGEGLEAAVGEDGRGWSAGERTRLALARALLTERRWVLLDEPTARLDPRTAARIAEVIGNLAVRASVIVATHDPALIARADHLIELTPPEASEERSAPSRPFTAPDTSTRPERSGGRLAAAVLLEGLASASGVALTATAGWLIVKASQQPPVLTMLVAIVAVRAFGLGRPVLRYVGRVLGHDAVLRTLARRRVQVYEALVPLTPGALGRARGDVLATAVDDVESIVDRQLRVRAPLAGAAIVGVLVTLVSWTLAPAAAAVIAATCVVAGLGAFVGSRAGSRGSSMREAGARAALSSFVVETSALAPELVLWDATDRALARGMALAQTLAAATRRTARAVALARAGSLLMCAIGLVMVGVVGAAALRSATIGPPELALLILVPLALADVFVPLADAGAGSRRTAAAEARLEELMGRQPAVEDPLTPVPLPARTDLVLEHVTAGWPGAVVLTDLSLQVGEGSRLAVRGPSGCGKTTLAALLVRFIDPREGSVRLGGTDLRSLSLADVRGSVGIVDDSPYVFATTVAENLRLARRDATDEEIVAALTSVGLDRWLAGLQHGLSSMVGEGHVSLSGGERARLALARALLADQPILVLDEPTAHLDADTAAQTMDALSAATHGRSVVWITHSSAGLDQADAVLDLTPPAGDDQGPDESLRSALSLTPAVA